VNGFANHVEGANNYVSGQGNVVGNLSD